MWSARSDLVEENRGQRTARESYSSQVAEGDDKRRANGEEIDCKLMLTQQQDSKTVHHKEKRNLISDYFRSAINDEKPEAVEGKDLRNF